jgi:hypothetical protein
MRFDFIRLKNNFLNFFGFIGLLNKHWSLSGMILRVSIFLIADFNLNAEIKNSSILEHFLTAPHYHIILLFYHIRIHASETETHFVVVWLLLGILICWTDWIDSFMMVLLRGYKNYILWILGRGVKCRDLRGYCWDELRPS